MRLVRITLTGFKSFAKKTVIDVSRDITGIVGPNGSGKSNLAEAIRFVLGEQSMKTMRGKLGTDLIFKGSSSLNALSRASVAMVLDNRDKTKLSTFNDTLAQFLVYDEITLTREVFSDGGSDYTINGAKVRLKDVQELLALAGIGASKHTILSQGEADRILLLDPKDRRELIEDALGLRVYQIRLKESERKLARTETHIKEVELLEREIAPHLTHLKRQVEKIERANTEREHYSAYLHTFLYGEHRRIMDEEKSIDNVGSSFALALILDSVRKEIEVYKKEDTNKKIHSDTNEGKQILIQKLKELDQSRNAVTRELGKLEAERGYLERELARAEKDNEVTLPGSLLTTHKKRVVGMLDDATTSLADGQYDDVLSAIKEAREAENSFAEEKLQNINIDDKKVSLHEVAKKIEAQEHEEKRFTQAILSLQEEIDKEDARKIEAQEQVFEREKHVLTLSSKVVELEGLVRLQEEKEKTLQNDKQFVETLTEEGKVLIGPRVYAFKTTETKEHTALSRHELLRAIERSKLRIEESGVLSQDEVLQEFKQVSERSEYLKNELLDVKKTKGELTKLINELEDHIKEEFESGLTQISGLFSEYFKEVFGGGNASLKIVEYRIEDDEDLLEESKATLGVEINVNLPAKKVKSLALLSGGEKALTSIALLFAMASIAPPPFIVLDETDAPLDEHNAARYGEMLKKLSEKSKLLVITHNRETMSHCHMLYGITLGLDGGSKLLSIELK